MPWRLVEAYTSGEVIQDGFGESHVGDRGDGVGEVEGAVALALVCNVESTCCSELVSGTVGRPASSVILTVDILEPTNHIFKIWLLAPRCRHTIVDSEMAPGLVERAKICAFLNPVQPCLQAAVVEVGNIANDVVC